MKTPKNKQHFIGKMLLGVMFLVVTCPNLFAQEEGITIYQYRHVPADKTAEYVEKETTYWSKVAEKGLEGGNLTFWALLEKMGGYDLPNSSNYLLINTYNDIDNIAEVWNAAEVFPDVEMEKMDTWSISTVTSQFFVKAYHWEQATHAQNSDFNYLSMVYHNSSNPGQLLALEKEHWAPFIKDAMDQKLITQVGWGNAMILSPSGDNIKFNTVSYDVYPNLKETLWTTNDPNITYPQEGLQQINEIELNRRGIAIYRIVMVVQAPPQQ